MQKVKYRFGGFAAQNSGNIKNCYSLVNTGSAASMSAGFVANNSGKIENSFSHCNFARLDGGFSASNSGTLTNCYYLHNKKEGNKRVAKLYDVDLCLPLSKIKNSSESYVALGYDLDTTWVFCAGSGLIKFKTESWLYETTRSNDDIVISTAAELFKLAGKINGNGSELRKAHIRLAADIDLGGKEWTPIGADRTKPFSGLFDGCGHCVKNFKVTKKSIEHKGFFGFLKGEVYNLTVDCFIKGGISGGGIAAQNDGGIIGCCAAIVDIKANSGSFGGLVGKNTGEIFLSYSAGKLTSVVIPVFIPIAVSAVLVAGIAVMLILNQSDSKLPSFAPVPYDKDQIPVEEDKLTPKTDGHFVSFQFEQEVDVSLSTGKCAFNFINPGDSNHNIVVQLQFTDAQAIRVMGSTGRTQEEQARLEAVPGYDAENYRTVLAESGAIRPGYQLADLTLVSQANGATIPPGKYNAIVYLIFYDILTNNRAMLESQLPVVITVH